MQDVREEVIRCKDLALLQQVLAPLDGLLGMGMQCLSDACACGVELYSCTSATGFFGKHGVIRSAFTELPLQ